MILEESLSHEFLKFHILLEDFTKSTHVVLPFWPLETQKTKNTRKIHIFEYR